MDTHTHTQNTYTHTYTQNTYTNTHTLLKLGNWTRTKPRQCPKSPQADLPHVHCTTASHQSTPITTTAPTHQQAQLRESTCFWIASNWNKKQKHILCLITLTAKAWVLFQDPVECVNVPWYCFVIAFHLRGKRGFGDWEGLVVGGRERENSNLTILILKDSSIRSIWT